MLDVIIDRMMEDQIFTTTGTCSCLCLDVDNEEKLNLEFKSWLCELLHLLYSVPSECEDEELFVLSAKYECFAGIEHQ